MEIFEKFMCWCFVMAASMGIGFVASVWIDTIVSKSRPNWVPAITVSAIVIVIFAITIWKGILVDWGLGLQAITCGFGVVTAYFVLTKNRGEDGSKQRKDDADKSHALGSTEEVSAQSNIKEEGSM